MNFYVVDEHAFFDVFMVMWEARESRDDFRETRSEKFRLDEMN